jgi:AcrR family transcriptional regulator
VRHTHGRRGPEGRHPPIDAILAEVGISKTAFYKHFASKDDLMVGVLEDVDRSLQQQLRQIIKQGGDPTAVGQLRAVLDLVQIEVQERDFHGCIFVNAAIEFPLRHDPAHEASLRHKRAIEEFVYELAERAGAADPKAMAQELCLVIEGAYVTRTVTGDPATISIARRLADEIIDHHVPADRRTPPRSPTS